MTLHKAKTALMDCSDPVSAENKRKYFKNCQNDIFLGVSAASVKKIAKEFSHLGFEDILPLFQSHVHEERSLATALLCRKYCKASESEEKEIFDFYIHNRHQIREWNGVDDSAPYIVGAYLLEKNKELLYQLVRSESIWDRRIAIVATWWFIRHGKLEDTLNLAELLLDDREDLIHKAAGWMLREVGKRNITALKHFLEKHHTKMPRMMLRYSIEKFSDDERKEYLIKSRDKKHRSICF